MTNYEWQITNVFHKSYSITVGIEIADIKRYTPYTVARETAI